MKRPPLTKRRLRAALASINAHLAGEEGEGDLSDVSFADLEAARESLAARLDLAPEREPITAPSAAVVRGLRTVSHLAYADLEAAEPGDFAGERQDAHAALTWIDSVIALFRRPSD